MLPAPDKRRARGGCYARPMPGTLYLVAVPIGNPDDLSPRARETLRSVAVVAAEDTRHFATLARQHGLAPRAVSYHDHNEGDRAAELIGRLRAGDDVALVSDAGTPLVSDPGYRLVRAAIDAVRPWAVDASSSLESAPGIKDHARVRAYVEAARG